MKDEDVVECWFKIRRAVPHCGKVAYKHSHRECLEWYDNHLISSTADSHKEYRGTPAADQRRSEMLDVSEEPVSAETAQQWEQWEEQKKQERATATRRSKERRSKESRGHSRSRSADRSASASRGMNAPI